MYVRRITPLYVSQTFYLYIFLLTSLGCFYVLGLPPCFFLQNYGSKKCRFPLSSFFFLFFPLLPIISVCFNLDIRAVLVKGTSCMHAGLFLCTVHRLSPVCRGKGTVKGKKKPPTQGVRVGGAYLSTI